MADPRETILKYLDALEERETKRREEIDGFLAACREILHGDDTNGKLKLLRSYWQIGWARANQTDEKFNWRAEKGGMGKITNDMKDWLREGRSTEEIRGKMDRYFTGVDRWCRDMRFPWHGFVRLFNSLAPVQEPPTNGAQRALEMRGQ